VARLALPAAIPPPAARRPPPASRRPTYVFSFFQ
jgi:hypothetical protein